MEFSNALISSVLQTCCNCLLLGYFPTF